MHNLFDSKNWFNDYQMNVTKNIVLNFFKCFSNSWIKILSLILQIWEDAKITFFLNFKNHTKIFFNKKSFHFYQFNYWYIFYISVFIIFFYTKCLNFTDIRIPVDKKKCFLFNVIWKIKRIRMLENENVFLKSQPESKTFEHNIFCKNYTNFCFLFCSFIRCFKSQISACN